MTMDNLKCFRCGELGHLSAGCPKHAQLQMTAEDVAMPWCGICDPRTRIRRGVEPTSRCPSCHPKRHEKLVQHTRCKGCRKIICVWDVADCDRHQSLGPKPYVGKAKAAPAPLAPTQLAAQQAAESRAIRTVLP